MQTSLRIVTVGILGGDELTRPFRPPISLSTIVARNHMCTYAANVWDLSIVQGHSLSNPNITIRNFFTVVRVVT
jgi:hypothetical protein